MELTAEGRQYAVRVMRKHRLAERLLTDVIGLDWSLVHNEACRWEHVISTDVEQRLVRVLDEPRESPYGNPIPGLDELGGPPPGLPAAAGGALNAGVPLTELAGDDPLSVTVRRVGELIQTDVDALAVLEPGRWRYRAGPCWCGGPMPRCSSARPTRWVPAAPRSGCRPRWPGTCSPARRRSPSPRR